MKRTKIQCSFRRIKPFYSSPNQIAEHFYKKEKSRGVSSVPRSMQIPYPNSKTETVTNKKFNASQFSIQCSPSLKKR